MTNSTFAVQPAFFGDFDPWGCDWAKDIDHAYDLARYSGVESIIWKVPQNGNAMRWIRVTEDELALGA